MRKPTDALPPDHPEVVAERLSEMERKLDRLRSLYESFFAGSERRPPNTPRREMNRLMLETQQLSIRNVGLRFRFQSLSQRWTLYSTYWNRTMREIEAGTYRKDLAKAQRRLAQRGKPLTESEAVTLGIPLTRAKAFVERQNRYLARTDFDSERTVSDGTPLPPAPPPPTEPEIPGLSDEDIAVLQKKYNEALSGLGSDGDHQAGKKRAPITAAKLKAMLSARVPAILQQQGATRVAFDVATRDGRVVLKAKPIK
ncbi:MAG TPA: MXAN_5187 C-terminal domain-containing protein [Polyangia bacterium]